MADVFVSYSRADKLRVMPLVAAIEEQGWSIWWDPAITPGQEFDRMIATELSAAAAVLVVWSATSVDSRWVRGEARDGADRGILVPVRVDNASLPIDFRAFHTIELPQDFGDGNEGIGEIIRALSLLIHGTQTPASQPGKLTVVTAHENKSPRVGIAVLPFTNLGTDPEHVYFCDGITGDIITELGRWHSLLVRSRSASFRYRDRSVDPVQVARELDVQYVVEGSVRRIGARIRISVQLVDGETGSQLWGEKFDRDQSDIFAVQDEVVQTIVATLVGRVQTSDVERARRKVPSSLAAYECVQRGNALQWDDPGEAAEAVRFFEQAIALDPTYAMAHALLGTMRIAQYRKDPADSTAALDEAYALTRRAVELDDGDSTCHSLLAHAYLYKKSYDLALQHMQRSVTINPNNAWNRADMGLVLTYTGRPEEALEWLKKCREVDPYFDPGWYWRQSGQAYMVLRRFDEALKMFAYIRLHTERSAAYVAACQARLGNDTEMQAFVHKCLSLNPDFSVRQFISKEPFRNAADADNLAEALLLAGLPE